MDMERADELQARQRLMEGGYLVALGVPAGVEFGVDLKSYKTGPHFKGVKMIPAGLHFAHYGTGEGEKQGIFFRSGAGVVSASQWDATAEDLVDAESCLPGGALRALRESVLRLEMDANLGPYPFEQRASWVNLSNCITDSVLERCGVRLGSKVLAGSSAAQSGEPGGDEGGGSKGVEEVKGAGAAAAVGMEIVPHFPHVGRVARFCRLPVRTAIGWPSSQGADGNAARSVPVDPQEITKRNMDGSAALSELIASTFEGEWKELLGELQLSFVLFVSLSSLRGFRHWQALSALLCRCGDALSTNPPLFVAFIRLLHAHLKLVPEDFFDVELSKDNFLVPCLSALLQNILPDETLAPSLIEAAKRLLKFLQRRFGLFAGGSKASNSGRPSSPTGDAAFVNAVRQDGDDDQYMMDFDSDAAVFVPGEGLVDDGDEDDEPRARRVGERAALREELSLMQLELCEDDQPAVVPYEEVARVLGGEAFGGLPAESISNSTDNNSPPVSPSSKTSGTVTKRSQNSVALSTPSVEHSRRWQDIDRLLTAASPKRGPGAAAPSSQRRHPPTSPQPATHLSSSTTASRNGSTRSAVSEPTAGRARTAAWSRGYAASAASRYPLLFRSTAANEDVMMAAARLVSEGEKQQAEAEERWLGLGEGSGLAGVSARADVEQAVAFLQEIGNREDGGASTWLPSVPLQDSMSPGRAEEAIHMAPAN